MEALKNIIQRLLALEPALVIATAAGLLAIAANFGLPVAGIDVPQIVTTVFNFLTLVAAVLGIRQSVYSPATHEREVREASEDWSDWTPEELGEVT